jgi:PleD family two-component response regulator
MAGPGESLESLIDRADVAMRAAKRAGRNQVTMAPDEAAMGQIAQSA